MSGQVLIVEDEPVVALDLEQILIDAGIAIAGVVGSVNEALQLLQSASIDAAVLDQSLNGESVEHVAAVLRQKGTPFVIVSGFGHLILPKEYSDAPMLKKPVDPKQLVGVVEKLLHR